MSEATVEIIFLLIVAAFTLPFMRLMRDQAFTIAFAGIYWFMQRESLVNQEALNLNERAKRLSRIYLSVVGCLIFAVLASKFLTD